MVSLHSPKILAIDPGLSGAVVCYDPNTHEIAALRDFKDIGDIAQAVQTLTHDEKTARAVIEIVGSRPKQGIVSTSHFMIAYGTAMGAIGVQKLSGKVSPKVFHVAPQRWQNWVRRELSLYDDAKTICKELVFKPDFKEFDSRVYAINCFPEQPSLFTRGKDHNTADAALMAVYAYWFGNELQLGLYLTQYYAYMNNLCARPAMTYPVGLDKYPTPEDQPYQI